MEREKLGPDFLLGPLSPAVPKRLPLDSPFKWAGNFPFFYFLSFATKETKDN